MLNTIWIGIEADENKEALLCNAPLVFQVCRVSPKDSVARGDKGLSG